jgi:hypothetical protein
MRATVASARTIETRTRRPMPMPPIHISCLCAAWCQLFDDFRPMLGSAAAEMA